MPNAMNIHVDNLLDRVEKRVPKLIDQLALVEIREAVKFERGASMPICECCESDMVVAIKPNGYGYHITPCQCVVPEESEEEEPEPISEKADKAFHDIAKRTNDPEILTIIGKVLGK